MDGSKLFKIGSIFILLVNVVLIIFGAIYAIYGKFMPYHLAFIGVTPEEIAELSPNLLILSMLSIVLIGFLFLSNGVVNVIIWYKSFRKGGKWAWVAALISGALITIPLLGVIYTVSGFGFPFPLGCASLILWVVGILLTAKQVFTSK